MSSAANVYDRAAALWVAKQTNLDADKISEVTFTVIRGGYCETCAYESSGIEFKYGGKVREYEFPYGVTMASFLEESVALLSEVESDA